MRDPDIAGPGVCHCLSKRQSMLISILGDLWFHPRGWPDTSRLDSNPFTPQIAEKTKPAMVGGHVTPIPQSSRRVDRYFREPCSRAQ